MFGPLWQQGYVIEEIAHLLLIRKQRQEKEGRIQGSVPIVISHLSPTSSFAEPPQIVPLLGTKCSNRRSWETLHVQTRTEALAACCVVMSILPGDSAGQKAI